VKIQVSAPHLVAEAKSLFGATSMFKCETCIKF